MEVREMTRLLEVLSRPNLSENAPAEEIYRAACIGAVTLLYEAGDSKSLETAVLRGASPETRARALAAIRNLTRGPEDIRTRAVRVLYELAVMHSVPAVAAFLQKSGLQDSDPGWNSAGALLFGQKHRLLKEDPGPEKLTELFLSAGEPLRLRLTVLGEKVLPGWTALMKFFNDPSGENRSSVIEAYKTFTPDERNLVRHCVSVSPEAASLPADLLLRYEDDLLLQLCRKHCLKPSDPSREALFYFLSGQWEDYYRSDSDFRRIRLAYEEKDPDLQRRLIAVSRESGNNAWLRNISGDPENIPHDGTLSDQHLLIRSLTEQEQWGRLWEILPNVPLLCMPDVCAALEKAGHKPSRIEEASFLKELSEKIRACEGLSPIPLSRIYCEGAGNTLSFSGGGNRIAALFADRQILVWDTREPDGEPIRIGSGQMAVRRILLSNDGKYLCADCGSGVVTVFTLPAGQAVKTLRGDGSPLIGIFLQPDDRRIILFRQNGKGSVLTFPGGAELFGFDIGLKDCSRASYDAESGRLCGITYSGDCAVYDIGEKRTVTMLRICENPMAVCESFSAGKLSFIDRDERLWCMNLISGKPVHQALDCGEEKVRRLYELNRGDLYLLGTLSGQLRIFDPTAMRTAAVLSAGSKSSVTGVCCDPESAMLYSCTANGTVKGWDAGLFKDMVRTLPLLRLPGMNRIEEFRKKYPEPGVKAAAEWLKTVTAWRRRFDIEIDFGD